MKDTAIVELVLFKLTAGSNEADFIEAAQGINTDLETMPGFIERRLLQTDDQWADLVFWESLEHAQSAAESVMQLEEMQKFGAFIAQESMQFMHLHPVNILTKA